MTPAISIRALSKRYRKVQALDGVTLDIAQGEFFGLLGPNGAGKTTLINALAGLARPDAGSIAGFILISHKFIPYQTCQPCGG